MNRREALSAVTFLLGGTVIGAEVFLSGCSNAADKSSARDWSDEDVELLNDIGETILPATAKSPGARDAKVGEFMKTIVTDCYTPEEQKIFQDGLIVLNEESDKLFEKKFIELDTKQKHEFLLSLENEAANYASSNAADKPKVHYYAMIKQLDVWGFLSSEAGATKALRHVAIPGKYEGCIPLPPGEKAWG
jgi:hypothetical protein